MTDELLAIFNAKRPDGSRKYSREETREFVPLLAMASGAPYDTLSVPLQAAIRELCARAGVTDGMEEPRLLVAVERYYREHPLNPQLLAEFSEFVMRALLPDFEATPERLATAFSKVIEAPLARHAPISQREVFGPGVSGEEPPEGSENEP